MSDKPKSEDLEEVTLESGIKVKPVYGPEDITGIDFELGPNVEILGGVEVPTLLGATPAQVYKRAREILQSGVSAGGRFILRDANNLPPNVPWPNLAAMYKAAFDFGTYRSQQESTPLATE